jgi:hypothetical protein
MRLTSVKLGAIAAIGLVGCSYLTTAPAALAYNFTLIADTAGQYNFFADHPVSINDRGVVAFRAFLDNGEDGIYTGDGTTITNIVNTSGQFSFFDSGASEINNNGVVVFRAFLDVTTDYNNTAIFTSDGTTTTRVDRGPVVPYYVTSGVPDINNNGEVSFYAGVLNGTVGIYKRAGTNLITIADTTGNLRGFDGAPKINDSGTVAFWSVLNDNSRGIYRGNGTALPTLIASSPTSFFRTVNFTGINNSGLVAFNADQIPNNNFGRTGVYTSDGSNITPYFPIPTTPYPINANNNQFSLNDRGLIAFRADFAVNSPVCPPLPPLTPCLGIFTGDDLVNDRVITRGDTLFGSTVTGLSLFANSLNNNGQIAFTATLADGRQVIVRANGDNSSAVPEPNLLLGLTFFGGILGRQIARKRC